MSELSSLTFDQLKSKLKEVYNDPVKANTIRQLMKEKYIYYQKKRELMMKNNREHQKKPKSEFDEYGFTDNDFNFDEESDSNKQTDNIDNFFSDEDFKMNPTHGNLDELADPEFDEKFETEVERDHLNNHLMSRMDAEMQMRKNQKLRKADKNFLSPFANGTNGEYSSAYGDDQTIRDFTSKRFVRNKDKVDPYFIRNRNK